MTQDEFMVETGLILKTCPACGIIYAIPKRFDEGKQNDHKTFYCPKGHHLHYSQKSDKEELAEKLEEAEACCDIYKSRERRRDYQKRYYKGRLAKLERGVANAQE